MPGERGRGPGGARGRTPAAQEGAEEGGTEVEMQEEGGSAQDGEGLETGTRADKPSPKPAT